MYKCVNVLFSTGTVLLHLAFFCFLACRSLEEELHVLLPVLLAHAPRIRMREASAALLRTRFAPSLLHVSAMNDPLSLERFVLVLKLYCSRERAPVRLCFTKLKLVLFCGAALCCFFYHRGRLM